ncbi:SOS response-associated peptidase [Caballeronia sp. LZ062]|uniref:SOS response-associated peptidase n=1 Tax=unclassified Caballeronia TaxID=2646786 RepID=UPI002863D173|nr:MULTISPECIES: SOS response-associated peptidase [unclassified Caballeronia]MDR5854252.1 SOS response-associated peptidase [Caballeronia sp. LZ050]MDR5871217.1 SOS response-associated peptidase [Caballeronia sp. LZ062]
MCGRISQYRLPMHYAQRLHLKNAFVLVDAADRRPGYNLSPGTHPLAVYPDETIRAVHWGYCPPWAREQKLPHTINARVETASTSAYFRDLWRNARILVPADGWFEWRVEPRPGDRAGEPFQQPYFIRRADGEPMFLAALTSIIRDEDAATPGAGFVLVTSKADEGLVDVHDRRPLVFSPSTGRRWLDTAATPADLHSLVKTDGVPAAHFVWHRVTTDVNRTLNDEPRLIEPLEAA